jgi:transposase
MPKFIPYDYNQSAMVVINYLDQLQPGTFEHAIHYLIDNKLDLSIFHNKYQNEDNGRPAYAHSVLLKIILFAYSRGITSSREIQWCCETNIIFKALSCDTVPHFTTIAAFVSGSSGQIAQLFEQVLLVCHQQGLLGNELFAIDGCKMPSNAAKEANNSYLYQQQINGYIPDNQFRKRDPKFSDQKQKYGKRHQDKAVGQKVVIPASAFEFDPIAMSCICPSGLLLSSRGSRPEPDGQQRALFTGKLLQCRSCDLKEQCMVNPESANHRKGSGRQVSFLLKANAPPNYTDWMRQLSIAMWANRYTAI